MHQIQQDDYIESFSFSLSGTITALVSFLLDKLTPIDVNETYF